MLSTCSCLMPTVLGGGLWWLEKLISHAQALQIAWRRRVLCGENNGLNCGLEDEIISETRDLRA